MRLINYLLLAAAMLFSISTAEAAETRLYSFSLVNGSDVEAAGYYRFGATAGTVGTLAPGEAIHEGYVPFGLQKKAEIVFTCRAEKEEVCASVEADLRKHLPKGRQFKSVEALFTLGKDKRVSLSFKAEERGKVHMINVGPLPAATGKSPEWIERFNF